jgi:epoxide hydrolase-like predicted phosphatase
MSIRAVFFDMGGVIVRTEFQAPRQHLAERLGLEYEDIERLVFNSPSSQQASVGKISSADHWSAVTKRLGRPPSETEAIREAFFAGDIVDRELLAFIHSLRPRHYTGLISNAWSDLREYIEEQKFADAFEHLVISAEVGAMKPEAHIYQLALELAGVSPDEAVFVDDMQENIEGCQAVGMHGIHFRNAQQSLGELQRMLD